MVLDKYSAVWISHSSISDFIACPKAYFYANVYKNPRSGKKITIMNSALALGQAVHEVLDRLSDLPVDQRFSKPLEDVFKSVWELVSGKKGGFINAEEEKDFYDRGILMMQNVTQHPGIFLNKAVKLPMDLPNFWLSETEGIILCGKIDWIEYFPETDSIHIIDFKTGKRDEKEDSLQLPIYYLLVSQCQKRKVEKMSFWYLDRDIEPKKISMPNAEKAKAEIMKIAVRIKLARQLNHFKCSKDDKFGCRNCAPYEAIIKGRGEFVGTNMYDREVYILPEEAKSL